MKSPRGRSRPRGDESLHGSQGLFLRRERGTCAERYGCVLLCAFGTLRAFAGWHDPIRAILEATPESAIVRTDIQDRDPLPSWTRGLVTLLGEAAHPMTANIGQGACQAIVDAVVLGEEIGRGVGRARVRSSSNRGGWAPWPTGAIPWRGSCGTRRSRRFGT